MFGGVDIKQQLPIVRAGVEILVATPGRLLDHVEQKSVNLSQVEIFVLDEADRMLDMGFIPDIKRIMALLPATAKRQNLLFSATFSNEIKKLADQLLNAPELIEVARRNTAAETVEQSAYKCPQDAKRALLTHIVRSRGLRQVLCFVRTKHGASRLARQLEKDGLETSAIHGDKTQGARIDALAAFKEGKLEVLVATDVAARGLDVDDLPLVVNYELPHVPEDYIHRIGRTGRAGATGEAISFVAPEEEKYLAEIERLLKKKIAVRTLDGFDPAPPASAPRHRIARRARKTRAAACRRKRRAQKREPRRPRTRASAAASRAAAASRSARRPTRAIPTSRVPRRLRTTTRRRRSSRARSARPRRPQVASRARAAHEAQDAGTQRTGATL